MSDCPLQAAARSLDTFGALELPVVSVKDVDVVYPLTPYLRRSLKTAVLTPFKRQNHKTEQYVHALKGVSFDLHSGERLGIVGSNGSGKSTLLRAVAGVYPLAAGSITLRGQARGLFDLGAGFLLEETGRNNIYHRGLLLGESRADLRQLESAIIDFAGLGRFIDLPMKTYSAGMVVRLAYAISILVEGDILLIDEVFSAGDKAFTEKAKAQMLSKVLTARCIIFVSHDLAAIQELCTRAIWMKDGQVSAMGMPIDVIGAYIRHAAAPN